MATKAEKRALRLKQRKEDVKKQRSAADKRRRNKTIINGVLISIVVIAVAVVAYIALMPEPTDPRMEQFAKCLTTSGAGMYGTDWCSNCQEQKRMFGDAFRYVTYINCEQNTIACENQQVTGYPTWIFNDGEKAVGLQQLIALADKTDCSLE